jgi:amidase
MRYAKDPASALVMATVAVTGLLATLNARGVLAQELTSFNLIEATIPEMQAAMESGLIDSEYLVGQYLRRIDAFDVNGPMLNSVLSLNPEALNTARALDAERAITGPRGPLHGIPILLKDNIDTVDMPTTAGSIILQDSVPPDDAFLTRRLRDAGAVILGKANLTEFANFVSLEMPNGFSALGGQVLNPYGPGEFDPFGSSAGSAVAVAANLAAVAVGTETLGSIISPASINGVVGIRPTVGLVSRDGIVPISFSQDTAGPITRTVTDAAIMLGAMTGVDENDPATLPSEGRFHTDYTPFLNPNGLEGKRVGIIRSPLLDVPDGISQIKLDAAEVAFAQLESLGATVIDDLDFNDNFFGWLDLFTVIPEGFPFAGETFPPVMLHEFPVAVADYLESLGPDAPATSLEEIVAFNEAHAAEAIPFGQSVFELSLEIGGDLTDVGYLNELSEGKRLFGEEGFAALLAANDLDALVFTDTWSALGAVPGYPSISVPAGFDENGEPVSIEFLAGPFSEPTLIEIAYAFEQGTRLRLPPASAPAIAGDLIPEPSAVILVSLALLTLAAYSWGRAEPASSREWS